MSTGRSFAPMAQAFAGKTTAEPSGGSRSRDPLDELRDRVRPQASGSVDALQVAALLETSGVTDRVARARFGFPDVFDLAEAVRRRVGSPVDPVPAVPPPPRAGAWRDIGHGLIYLMPAAAFPAALSALDHRPATKGDSTIDGGLATGSGLASGVGPAVLLAIVLTGAVGWVVGGVLATVAYRLLGAGQPAWASRLLRWALVSAAPLGAAVAGTAAAVLGAGSAVMLLGAAATVYQLAVTILVIRRREARVLAAIAPALIVGSAFLMGGSSLRTLAFVAGLASVGGVFGLALWETFGPAPPPSTSHHGRTPPTGRAPRPLAWLQSQVRAVILALVSTALSAAFFLIPQVPHLISRFDVIVAMLPLVAGMGVVEWRAHRFSHDARTLLMRVTHPRQFAVRIWIVVLNGLCVCVATVGGLAGVVVGLLARAGRYTPDVAAMAVAGTVLAGAYFLGFLVANLGRPGWSCASLLLGLATYELARIGLPTDLGDAHAFAVAAAALLGLHLIGLVGVAGDARRHR